MDKNAAQFDAYSTDYSDLVDKSVSFSGQRSDFFHRVKVDVLLSLLSRYQAPEESSVLDVGCGTGSLAKLIAPHVKAYGGVDISPDSVEQARKHVSNCEFKSYDGTSLPYANDTIDFVFTSCVMHHVPVENWSAFTSQMARVVRPGGLVAVVEHNPWNPLTRFAVSTCEFDKDAVLLNSRTTKNLLQLAGLTIVEKPFILFFPWNAKLFRGVERRIGWLPLGAQYIVVGQKS